jgi:hypothetical protein
MRYSITHYRDRDRYVLVISARPDLNAAEKIALIRLAYHVNFKTGRCDPAAATLAKELGTHERRMRRTLAALERAGLLAIDRTHGRTSNQFTLMVPSMPSNPGQNARVEPGPSRPEAPGPTRANTSANPGELAPLTLKNSIGDVRTSPIGERDVGACAPDHHVGGDPCGPPTDAEASKEEKKEATGASVVVVDAFAQLRATWVRPWPDRDDWDARAAFADACRSRPARAIIASASAWVAAADAPRFLPKLSTWLADACYLREPPKKRGRVNGNGAANRFRRNGRPDLMRMIIAQGEGYVR